MILKVTEKNNNLLVRGRDWPLRSSSTRGMLFGILCFVLLVISCSEGEPSKTMRDSKPSGDAPAESSTVETGSTSVSSEGYLVKLLLTADGHGEVDEITSPESVIFRAQPSSSPASVFSFSFPIRSAGIDFVTFDIVLDPNDNIAERRYPINFDRYRPGTTYTSARKSKSKDMYYIGAQGFIDIKSIEPTFDASLYFIELSFDVDHYPMDELLDDSTDTSDMTVDFNLQGELSGELIFACYEKDERTGVVSGASTSQGCLDRTRDFIESLR